MTPNEIISLIAQKQTAIAAENAKIATWTTAEAAWRAQGNSLVCDQTFKSRREECEADKVWKLGRANEYLTNITAARATVTRLNTEITALHAAQAANNQAEINLSQNGTSYDATIIAAQGSAAAALQVSSAQAQATAEQSKAKTAATNAVKIAILVAAFVLVVIVYKFIKKPKK